MGFKQIGTNSFDIATMDTKSIVEIMHRFKANFLLTTPAYLMRIIFTMKQMGLDPSRDFQSLKKIMLATEAYPVDWALEVQELLGATLCEIYGCTQQGCILGSTCEGGVLSGDRRATIHCLEHLSAFEVIDRDSGLPVKPGEFGELVITNLTKHTSPAVRFATNDRVRFVSHTSCGCGRPFNGMEAGTISRYDDMLKIKGINVWPAGVSEVILGPRETVEYNARVYMTEEGKEIVEIRVEFVSGVPPEKKARLLRDMAEKILERTGIRMKLIEAAEVQKFEFKTKRWTDERQYGLDLKKLR
jgi:phenylacetate-CoA ligase